MTSIPAAQIGLIRHAPTQWNEQKKIQGQNDPPLSDRGILLAESWGGELKNFAWQRILCSDLVRARETAALVNRTLPLPVSFDSSLREQDWGNWSGLTLAEIRKREHWMLSEQVRAGWMFRPPGGESRREVLARALKVVQGIQARWPGENILVICHEGVIKCLVYHLMGRMFLPDEPKVLKNYYLHLLVLKGQTLYLEQLNRLALTGSAD